MDWFVYWVQTLPRSTLSFISSELKLKQSNSWATAKIDIIDFYTFTKIGWCCRKIRIIIIKSSLNVHFLCWHGLNALTGTGQTTRSHKFPAGANLLEFLWLGAFRIANPVTRCNEYVSFGVINTSDVAKQLARQAKKESKKTTNLPVLKGKRLRKDRVALSQMLMDKCRKIQGQWALLKWWYLAASYYI